MTNIPSAVTIEAAGKLSAGKRALADMIARADQLGEAWRVPFLRAAYQGAINLSVAHGGARFPARLMKLTAPTLAILADDVPTATGPDAWPQARRLLRWASGVILHATGGQAQHSVVAVEMTVALRRVVMIEMEYRHHAEWLALATREAPRLRVLNLVPLPGGQHPVQGAPAGTVVQ